MQAVRVGVVMGGVGEERSRSFEAAGAVASALQELGHQVVPVDLSGDSQPLEALAGAHLDVAFLSGDEKVRQGLVQGLLEVLGIPYTGSGMLASGLATDELKSKELFRLHNVPTLPYYELTGADLELLGEVHGSFGYPALVRPRRGGLGAGLRVSNLHELRQVSSEVLRTTGGAVVERFVPGRQVVVGMLDGRVLGAMEREFSDGSESARSRAPLGATRLRGIMNLAERAAQALDVRGLSSVDLLVTEEANEFVLGVDTLPLLTPQGALSQIAEAAGYDLVSLCDAVLRSARLECPAPRAFEQAVSVSEFGSSPPALWDEATSLKEAGYTLSKRGRREESLQVRRFA